MVTTVLSDEVINSTELRNNQKRWLDKAYVSPVSIMSGNKKLVLLNRDDAKQMYLLTHYAEMIIQFCREQTAHKRESNIFPWIKYLDEEAVEDFRKELLATFDKAATNQEWSVLEELLDDWKATANVESNPKLAKILDEEDDPTKYVKVTD